MDKVMDQLMVFATTYGIRVIGAVLILVIGRIAAGVIAGSVRRLLNRSKVDPAVVTFAGSMTFALVLTFAVLAALSKFGVETASFVAVVGAAGFALGFALQGSLANFAAGVLILVLRPYKVGDYIQAGGTEGVVKGIHLFTTELASLDNIKILVPNGKLFGDNIKNLTGYDTRRVDLVFGISYGSSIAKAKEIAERLMKEDPRVLDDPAPAVHVGALADSSVNLNVWPWVKPADYWDVYFDLHRRIKDSFDAEGIEIPFPQRTLHMAPGSKISA